MIKKYSDKFLNNYKTLSQTVVGIEWEFFTNDLSYYKTMELLTFIGEKLGQTPVVRPDIGVGWCCLNSQDRQLWCKFSLNEDKTKYILSYRSKIGHVVSEIEEIHIDFDDKIYKDDILEYSMEEIFT